MDHKNESLHASIWQSSQPASVPSYQAHDTDNSTYEVQEKQECILDRVSRMSLSTPRPVTTSTTDEIVKIGVNKNCSTIENRPSFPTTPLRSGASSTKAASMPSFLLPSMAPSLDNGEFRLDNEYRVLSETIRTGNMASSRRHRINARRMTQRRNQGVAKKRRERTTLMMTTKREVLSTPRSVTPSLEESNENSFSIPSLLTQHYSSEQVKVGVTNMRRPNFSPCRTVSDNSLDCKIDAGATTYCKTPNKISSKPFRAPTSMSPLFATHPLTSSEGASLSTPGSLRDESHSLLAAAEDNEIKLAVPSSTFSAHVQPSGAEISQKCSSADLFPPSLMAPSFSVGSHDRKRSSPVRLLHRSRSNNTTRLPRICYRPKKNLCATPTIAEPRRRVFRRSAQVQSSNIRMRPLLLTDKYSTESIFRPAAMTGNDMPVIPMLSPAPTPAGTKSMPRTNQLGGSMLSPFETFVRSVENGDGEWRCKNDIEESPNLEEMAREGLTMPVF